MREEDMVRLSEQEVQRIERINDSFARREEAEAAKEGQQKMRVLFERTAREALPFVVYVIYMGAMGPVVVFKLLDYDGLKLGIGVVVLLVVMLAPLLLLPRASLGWLGQRFRNMHRGTSGASPDSEAIASPESD